VTIETKGKQLPLLVERRIGQLWLCQLTNSFNSQLLRAATLWVVSGGAYAVLGDAGLRGEAREQLLHYRPLTLGQAARLSGVTPADVVILMVHLDRKTVDKAL